MQISESIDIKSPKMRVWSVITDIENAATWLSNIKSIEIIDSPESGINGLKWKEVRNFCGKEASEIMWITNSIENDHYCVRAESHGAVYLSQLSINESDEVTTLTMSFKAEPQTFLAKLLSKIMNRFVLNSLIKEIQRDLKDIKDYVERASN
ncbi:SRPBCC family protein [Pseudoalteromonas luteoviolacea]|uniref:SRPBCC family protein n=1 Tax=Pseudoalteromonas luteoviolacea TaxID=43657 RepID=UPI001B394707|nr:SRPBCC family protein [Pseudoalteromonas luteoviolacea]MBQ4835795.1 SRPBCC family protein [Pseudoalteromonas luteoviolacea]